jgi:Protein of unknown function (DUF3667)
MDDTKANAVNQPVIQACANCATPSTGNYCSHCGQRLDTHIHSVWHFLGEATEVLTHADSRVWNTLLPLLTRPGFLTREFFAGHRARYLQPFRLYVILSVLFLLLASWLNNSAPAVNIEAGAIDVSKCSSKVQTDVPGASWLRPRLIVACQKILTKGGRELGQSVVHNLGRAMFIFLPLLAGFMKLLYWRPRRYYLEHLLLLLHNHAFVFLWLSVWLLATHWLRSPGLESVFSLAMGAYLTRYLYRSMKLVYAQLGSFTFLKFTSLLLLYLVCGLIMLLATTLFSAVTL